jgi:hypothetical protein
MMAHLVKALAILLVLGIDFAPAGPDRPLTRNQ